MKDHVKIKPSTTAPLKIKNSTLPGLDLEKIGIALGGEPIDNKPVITVGSIPVAWLRAAVQRCSRPANQDEELLGTNISLTKEDWNTLERLAKSFCSQGVQTTPERVASVLLHGALQSVASPSKGGG